MCGLTGSLSAGGEAGEARAPASSLLAHRGPDGHGAYADDWISLEFRRLAIVDPTPAGDQPMIAGDGRYAIVFNGEIYNYRELAEELRCAGVRLRTDSDTEVLLEAFIRQGPDVVHALRGMYAFAVWDRERRELVAARDPFGIKPFYYAWADGELRFASEKKALVEPRSHATLDHEIVRSYLAMRVVPGPRTMDADIRQLQPGHLLVARPGEPPELRRFWQPRLRPRARPQADTAERVLEALRGSVEAHLRSDVPVGAFLSGGIDSAAVCALAATQQPDLKTFTVGFDHKGYNEIDRAQETAAALGLSSTSRLITAEELAAELPRIVWHFDDPLASPSATGYWFLAREASKAVKVVLCGEGADELFAGYDTYNLPPWVRAFRRLPGPARAAADAAARMLPEHIRYRESVRYATKPLDRSYVSLDHVFIDAQVDRLTRGGRGSVYDVTDAVHRQARRDRLDDLATMQLVDLNFWLVDDILASVDRMSMAHGLELRVPYLDREVMEVASELARSEKIAKGTTKVALRQALAEVLPASVVNREKLGFPIPLAIWLRDELYEFSRKLLGEAEIDEYVDRRAALDLLARYRAGERFSFRRIWVLICFALWHQVYVEQRYDPVALGWCLPAEPINAIGAK